MLLSYENTHFNSELNMTVNNTKPLLPVSSKSMVYITQKGQNINAPSLTAHLFFFKCIPLFNKGYYLSL